MVSTEKLGTVCVIGIWHLGVVNSVGFCEKGYRVIGIEFDATKTARLQQGIPPLFEPGIAEMMNRHLQSGRLQFSSDPRLVAEADFVVVAYDSPVNDQDEVEVSPVVDACKAIAAVIRPHIAIVITSQIPLGTSEKIETLIRKINPAWESGVVYTPENLKLGEALARFLQPDMLVLGANSVQAREAALALYRPFQTEKLSMDLRSAEMVKHALNTFLATSITFINEMANIADRLGADAVAVGKALKFDKRIGKWALMTPGLGFSGGTLARDVTQLRKFAAQLNYKARLLDAIVEVNEGTFNEIVVKLQGKLGNLSGKRIGILGLTYKPGTSTLRRSPAIKIIEKLQKEGVKCLGYDPEASPQEVKQYQSLFMRVGDVKELAKNADGLVLVTEWPEFRDLDYVALASEMRIPFLVDTKNYLDLGKLMAAGFDCQGFGRSVRSGTTIWG
jgi:UDPglucose 6-dehydrogenase